MHGHGGMVLEHLKALAFHYDTRPGRPFLWFTTTGWMMWNITVSALLRRASLSVVVDGDPRTPTCGNQWRSGRGPVGLASGVSPGYLMACRAAGTHRARVSQMFALRMLGIHRLAAARRRASDWGDGGKPRRPRC